MTALSREALWALRDLLGALEDLADVGMRVTGDRDGRVVVVDRATGKDVGYLGLDENGTPRLVAGDG